jgi:hypothetical protein
MPTRTTHSFAEPVRQEGSPLHNGKPTRMAASRRTNQGTGRLGETIASSVVRQEALGTSSSWQGGTAMLVLTRRIGEKLVIDGVISVTVVASRETKPDSVSVRPRPRG